MYNKITKILFLALVVSILSYLFYYNPHNIELHTSDNSLIQMPLALLIVISFFLGIFALGVPLFFLGLKMKYSLWKSNKDIQEKEKHLKEISSAKDLLAIGNYKDAINLLNKIIQKDPHNIIAREILSEVLLADNSPQDSIKLLENTRAEERNSPFLLLKLANHYQSLGNLSASYDNIQLALKFNQKSIPLLKRAIELSRSLKRYQDAKNHIQILLKVCPYSEQAAVQDILAEVEYEEISNLKNTNREAYRENLTKLCKHHKNSPALQYQLAETYIEDKEVDLAVKTLKKLLTKNNSGLALEKLVNFWLENNNPNEAINILRTTINSKVKELEIPAEVMLLQVLIYLEQNEDARETLDKLKATAKNNPQISSLLIALQAKLESKTGGKAATNLSIEKIILKEAKTLDLPTIPPKVLHPNLTKDQLEILGYEVSPPITH